MSDTPEQTPDDQKPQDQATEVVCNTAKDPVVRLFIVAAMCLGFGLWCFTDLAHYPKPVEPFAMKHINEWSGYLFNAIGAYVLTPVGLIVLVYTFLFMKRRLVADAEGIGYAGKEKIRWEQVDDLDATKLKDKGILVVHAGDRALKLDAWKLKNFKELVAFVESQVPVEAQKTPE